MGWGLSIDQDDDGFVFCSEADFETGPEDYEGLPPHSYKVIADGVEEEHSTIDWTRDEVGLDAARAACRDAFEDAKSMYEDLDDDEKWKIHTKYVKELKDEMKLCVVDQTRKNEKEAQIAFFKTQYGPELCELSNEIARLTAELDSKKKQYEKIRGPLQVLEKELADIVKPAIRKKELQALIKRENEWAKEF
jgi:hypothetical protein